MTNTEKYRLQWKCRRGMLELDLILEKFLADGYDQLSADDQQAFDQLLDLSDPELIRYLLKFEVPEDERLRAIAGKITKS